MPTTKAQQKAVNKYMSANYDRVNLTMRKGEKAEIQAAAAAAGKSTNAYILDAIRARLAADRRAADQAEQNSGG